MKKLLIGCCAAALAVVANAASVKWSMGNGVLRPSPDGSAASERASFYTMLVFSATDSAAVTAALTGATVNYSTLSSLAKDTYQAGKPGTFSGVVSDLTGASATLFAVIFDTASGESIDKAGYYYVTGDVTQNTYNPTGTDTPTTAEFTASQMTGSWTAVGGGAIPEPTSGLLMALGVAALALRRKRA